MASVDPTTAEWLRSEALFVESLDGAVSAAWLDDAVRSQRVGLHAYQSEAQTESDRQLAFSNVPTAREVHSIPGKFRSLIGRTITVQINRLGYDAGLDVMVLGAQDNEATGMSQVTVLRRL